MRSTLHGKSVGGREWDFEGGGGPEALAFFLAILIAVFHERSQAVLRGSPAFGLRRLLRPRVVWLGLHPGRKRWGLGRERGQGLEQQRGDRERERWCRGGWGGRHRRNGRLGRHGRHGRLRRHGWHGRLRRYGWRGRKRRRH